VRTLFLSDKRGISNIIGYVLLIGISISLSVLVFNWLRFYVSPDEIEQCPDAIDVIIEDYACVSGANGFLNISLKNKGRFSVDGYILRVHDSPDAEFGFYILNDSGQFLAPGKEIESVYFFNGSNHGKNYTDMTFVEVQPFLMDGRKISCKSYAYQRIIC